MVRLPDCGKTLRICVTVCTLYRRVTDGRTDGQTDILPRHSPRYAYASRGKNDNSRIIELAYSFLWCALTVKKLSYFSSVKCYTLGGRTPL